VTDDKTPSTNIQAPEKHQPSSSNLLRAHGWLFEVWFLDVLWMLELGIWSFAMSFAVPANLEGEIDELISHYPQKRSASLMVLHAIQENFGWISQEAVEWTARMRR